MYAAPQTSTQMKVVVLPTSFHPSSLAFAASGLEVLLECHSQSPIMEGRNFKQETFGITWRKPEFPQFGVAVYASGSAQYLEPRSAGNGYDAVPRA